MNYKIKKIFKYDVNSELEKYFILNPIQYYCNRNILSIFHDKVSYQNSSSADDLFIYFNEFYNNKIFKQLINFKIDTYNLYNNNDKNIDLIDMKIKYYTMSRRKAFMITCWDTMTEDDVLEIAKFLDKNGRVYYIRKFKFTNNELISLMYQWYSDTKKLRTKDGLNEKIKYTSRNFDSEYKNIHIILFDNINNLPISGGQSKFKQKIRDIMLIKNKKLRGDDFIHINDYFCQTNEYCQVLLNKNSRDFLSKFNIDNFLSENFKKTRIMVSTYKNWLNKNCNLQQKEHFCLISGAILSIYGIRPSNDIDGIYREYEPKFDELVKKTFFNSNTKFFFSDIGSENWKESWKLKNQDWVKSFNNVYETIDDIIMDEKNIFYFMGIKFFNLEFEIKRKIFIAENNKKSPKFMADMWFFKKLWDVTFKQYNTFPELYNYTDICNFVKKQDKKYISKYKFLLKKNYNIDFLL